VFGEMLGPWTCVALVELALPMLPTCRTISRLLKESRPASREQVRGWGRWPNVLARVIDCPPLVQEHVVNGPFACVLVAAVSVRACLLESR
jgi:hypothetical protein